MNKEKETTEMYQANQKRNQKQFRKNTLIKIKN